MYEILSKKLQALVYIPIDTSYSLYNTWRISLKNSSNNLQGNMKILFLRKVWNNRIFFLLRQFGVKIPKRIFGLERDNTTGGGRRKLFTRNFKVSTLRLKLSG
jgi:hypothetical protein